MIGEFRFGFDALSWRISGMRFEKHRYEHWIEALDARMARVSALFEWLDSAYEARRDVLASVRAAGASGVEKGDAASAAETKAVEALV